MNDSETRVEVEDGSVVTVDCQVAIVQDYMAFRQVIGTLQQWYESNAMYAVLSDLFTGDDSRLTEINAIADAHNTLIDHAKRLEETLDKMGITIRPNGADFHALLHGAYPELECHKASERIADA